MARKSGVGASKHETDGGRGGKFARVGHGGQGGVHDFIEATAIERKIAHEYRRGAVGAHLDAKGATGPAAHAVEGEIVTPVKQSAHTEELFDARPGVRAGGERAQVERGIEEGAPARIELGEKQVERGEAIVEKT